MVEGQIICSNCDTENIINDVNAMQENNRNLNNSIEFNNSENTFLSYENSNIYSEKGENYPQEKSKKKNKVLLIIVIIIVLMLITIFLFLSGIFIISKRNVSSTIEKSKINSFISTYRLIKKEVQMRAVVCDDDCNDIYGINEHYALEIEDMGNYYKIELEYDGGVDLSQSDCAILSDVACSGDEIIGRIYK